MSTGVPTARRLLRLQRRYRSTTRPHPAPAAVDVTVRSAIPNDDQALARLAALDSARVPGPPVLVAEIDGELWAALSLSDGRTIADPFRASGELVELLTARAGQGRANTCGQAPPVLRGQQPHRPAQPHPVRPAGGR